MWARIRKCFELLTPRERRRWALLIPLVLVAGGLEAVGATAVLALVQLISDSSRGGLPIISSWLRRGEGPATVATAAAIVALFYVGKNLFLTLVGAVQSRILGGSIVSVSRRMLEGYLALPFAHHLRRNSAELIRNGTTSVEVAFGEVLEPSVAVMTESCIAAAIILVLAVNAPVLTLLTSAVLCTLLGTLLAYTRHALARWGREEQDVRRLLIQTLQQIFHGLKDIKIRGRERFYYESFLRQQRDLARAQYLRATWAVASRLVVETVFICGVLLVIMVATPRDGTRLDIVPLLGLYAYAGLRVIPSVNRILMQLGRIQYGSAAVDAVYADFATFRTLQASPATEAEQPITFSDRLVLTRVSFTYDSAPPALQDIDLVIRRGESVAIVGETGAGKSTLIDLILGLLQPSAGHIAVDGTDIFTALRSWQGKIGYVPQTVYLMDDSLRRNIAFGLPDAAIDEEKLQAAVRMAQLDGLITALPDLLDTIVGERGARLSGGERQRVAIARALYHQPELLVFDEATAALDSQTEREITRAIARLHGTKTVLVIAHRLSTVRGCDRLVLLRKGRIEAAGTFDDLLERSPQFRTLALADRDGA